MRDVQILSSNQIHLSGAVWRLKIKNHYLILFCCLQKILLEKTFRKIVGNWYVNQKKPSSNLRKLLQARMDKGNPLSELTADETKHLIKLEATAAR